MASARKSARLVPMSDRQNTAMSTEASPSGTCTGEERTWCVTASRFHRVAGRASRRDGNATHFSHVADGHQLADGRQVEAVHLVLHAARYLAVATAEVCDHQGLRPAGEGEFAALC